MSAARPSRLPVASSSSSTARACHPQPALVIHDTVIIIHGPHWSATASNGNPRPVLVTHGPC